VVLGLIAFSGAYLYGIGPPRRRYAWGAPVSRARVAAFLLGLGTLAFALLSPLDRIGDAYLFSVHMVQHMLIAMVVPPLLLLGTPGWLLRPLLRPPAVLRVARVLTSPYVAFALFNLDFWVWHAPALYDLTLTNSALHVFEHLTFLVFATLNWFPILSPVPDELPRLSRPAQLVYLFLSCQPMVLLGAGLTFASRPLYTPYVAAPRLFGLSALGDQQLGGLIMWLPGNFVYLLAISVVFYLWIERQGQETEQAERAAWEAEDALRAAASLDSATPPAPPAVSTTIE
jgi:cytochrome c oxidase assembly factor CtaG